MKRPVFFVVVMLLTFAFGVGLDRVIWSRPSNEAAIDVPAPLEIAAVEPQHELRPTDCPSVTPVAASTLIFDYDPNRFEPYGAYLIMDKSMDAFPEFNSIELILSQDLDGRPSGGISVIAKYDNNYESQDAVVAFVTERRLFFVAPQTSDSRYEYRFDGEFLRKDFRSVAGKKKAVLRGVLTKVHNGKKIVQRTVRFSMVKLGC